MKLSEVARLPSFALLGPGFTGRGHVLVAPLVPDHERPCVLYAPYESGPTGFSGEIVAFERLELDVAPAVVTTAFDEGAFVRGVATIREAIAAGDVYQVNLTTRVGLGDVAPEALFALLCRRGPPRFAAWVRAPGLEFVSASPELFFELDGARVRAEPMKGTAPPGMQAWLEASAKDDAELAMITDLMRNDLARVCVPRSVRVEHERRYLELPYAVQAVSDVVGTLPPGVGVRELLAALHPGGSITGAPKQAAREMIGRLEPQPRGPYCGALVFAREGRAVASLLIRTASRDGGGFTYGVGAGITWDSDARTELCELQTKLGALR